MPVDIVLSIIARDRPGLVQTLAELVASHDGNWVDSAMARLGGEFAGIVRVALPEASIPGFEQDLDALDEQGVTVSMRRAGQEPAVSGHMASFELTGGDHPGIVRDISSALSRRGVSIDALETKVYSGSMSGEQLFSAKARIVLPGGLDADDLRGDLEAIAQDIMVEIDLKEVE